MIFQTIRTAVDSSFHDLLATKNLVKAFAAGELPQLMHAAQSVTLFGSRSGVNAFRFLWRGQRDCRWPLKSRLFRELEAAHNSQPTAADLERAEDNMLKRFQATGLRESKTPVLEQLAVLQHQGAPTRLLDVSTDYLPALFFASDPTLDELNRPSDGLLIAFLANATTGALDPEMQNASLLRQRISTGPCFYLPQSFSRRIRAQRGAFIASEEPSGVPEMTLRWDLPSRPWADKTRDEVFDALGGRRRGRPGTPVVVALRIRAALKTSVREYLARAFRIDDNTMFPDIQGFVQAFSVVSSGRS